MKRKFRVGFTLTEALTVMAIVVILSGAAVPGALNAVSNMRQMSLNRAAETIYMAAQRNLVAAKIGGKSLSGSPVNSGAKDSADAKIVLPAKTISPTLYAGKWKITYNGYVVTNVYYSESIAVESLESEYTSAVGKVGYYG